MKLETAFEPVSCAVALSLVERAFIITMQNPRMRGCGRAKAWLRRRAPDILFDAALNEVSEPLIDALNAADHLLYSLLAVHKGDPVMLAALATLMMMSAAVCVYRCIIIMKAMC